MIQLRQILDLVKEKQLRRDQRLVEKEDLVEYIMVNWTADDDQRLPDNQDTVDEGAAALVCSPDPWDLGLGPYCWDGSSVHSPRQNLPSMTVGGPKILGSACRTVGSQRWESWRRYACRWQPRTSSTIPHRLGRPCKSCRIPQPWRS